ncbi:MAG: imidazolonepropionase [Bacteroidota bacterium]
MISLIKHITCLAGVQDPTEPLRGNALSYFPTIRNAYLKIQNGSILSFGEMSSLDPSHEGIGQIIDATGQFILPAWCDSHTHMVFTSYREEEFVDKINGLSYADIAAKGGGILNSALKLQTCSEQELFDLAWQRLQSAIRLGTGAMEIKSGYGLTVESELKMLRVIRQLKEKSPIPIKASFLGAHAYPIEYRNDHDAYIRSILEVILPVIADQGLADYIDVFCESGFFNPFETDRLLKAGATYGLIPKIHANQLGVSGGVEVGVANAARSVDHLEFLDDASIQCLSESSTIGTLLPACALFLRSPYPPARKLIESGAAIAIASDYNPGSSPCYNMNLVVALACSQMRMLPEEAINAATIQGAFAMDLHREVGSIAIGKKANLIFTKPISSLAYLPYSFGENLIERVMINGEFYS